MVQYQKQRLLGAMVTSQYRALDTKDQLWAHETQSSGTRFISEKTVLPHYIKLHLRNALVAPKHLSRPEKTSHNSLHDSKLLNVLLVSSTG